MKEYLEKFLGLFSEGVAKMQEGKEDEALEKMTEASSMTQDLLKKSEDSNEVDLKKFFESEVGKETLKKYVDMYLSASDVTSFVEQVKELAGVTESVKKTVENLKKEQDTDNKNIAEAIDKTLDKVESLEKTLETRVSKID